MRIPVVVMLAAMLVAAPLLSGADAQIQAGSVSYGGTWYVGENLEVGDYFEYDLCYVYYKECTDFEMQIWIEDEVQTGSEKQWLAQLVIYDGSKTVRGHMMMGQIASEPTGGSPEVAPYRNAFKSSIVWLSAFANADKEKTFNAPSWGKIANIGGEQILPLKHLNTFIVRGGSFTDVVQIGWKTGGTQSLVWVADDFPFPIKASTFIHSNITNNPPQEYLFELLYYEKGVTEDPFEGVVSTDTDQVSENCPATTSLKNSLKKSTKNFNYQLHVFYAPEIPIQGCPVSMQIEFFDKFSATLSEMQFDVLTVDDSLNPLRSIATEEGRKFLFSPSGQALIDFVVKEPVGTATFAIWVYGSAPEYIVPNGGPDYLLIELPIGEGELPEPTKAVPPQDQIPAMQSDDDDDNTVSIPSWIKQGAGWWAEGLVSDDDFVNSIAYLVENKIILLDDTPDSASSGENAEIPSWIKQGAGWWAEGLVSDDDFVGGIKYMIEQGIISIS